MSPRGYRNCRTYTPEVRQSAVAMVQAGTPVSAVAETMDIPRKSIVNWVKRAKQAPAPARAPADPPTYEALESEVRALRAEVAKLREKISAMHGRTVLQSQFALIILLCIIIFHGINSCRQVKFKKVLNGRDMDDSDLKFNKID